MTAFIKALATVRDDLEGLDASNRTLSDADCDCASNVKTESRTLQVSQFNLNHHQQWQRQITRKLPEAYIVRRSLHAHRRLHFIKIDSESDNSIKKELDSVDGEYVMADQRRSYPPIHSANHIIADNRNDAEKQITDQTNYLPKSRIVMVRL